MLKKTQFALIAAAALISLTAGSTQNVASWWTDHEPNHIITTDEVLPDGWWTDHEPNHLVAPTPEPTVVVPEWWTDHEPNH